MTITNKEKKYDSVKMMREIRDKLSRKYTQNPGREIQDLQIIREKYGIKSRTKVA